MSLFRVMQPTSVQETHCVDELIHGRPGKWEATPTFVNTAVGRMFKRLESAKVLAVRVGGFVVDLGSNTVVADFRHWA